jgi:hypothetical protein
MRDTPIEVPSGATMFHDQNGNEWTRNQGPRTLPVADKIKIINEVILPLRSYQIIGLIESRAWLEVLFPEFGDVRDREMDEYLHNLANNQSNNQEPQEVEDDDVR